MIPSVWSGKSTCMIGPYQSQRSIFFSFKFFITGTPSVFRAAALQCCSYWFFIGITSSFFFKKRASDGVSKPAPQIIPEQDVKLLMKASWLIGIREIFSEIRVFFVCLEKTSHFVFLNFLKVFISFLSPIEGR